MLVNRYITDLNGKIIEVTDLGLALLQADEYRHYRVAKPTKNDLERYAYSGRPVSEVTTIQNGSSMKTLIYFLCTCFIATCIYMVAIHSHNAVPGVLIACGLWAWFFWAWHKRRQKAVQRRERERLLDEWLRLKGGRLKP